MIGRPIDRASLHGADAQAVAGDDHRRARRGEIGPGAGMGNAELIEPRDRGRDILGAVIDVVGDADGVDAGQPQRLAADLRIGEKSLGCMRAPRRQMQTAFQIAEHHVGLVQR